MDTLDLIDALDKPEQWGGASKELVISPKSGQIHQAGSDGSGSFITEFRQLAEQNLYVFAKAILGRDYLSRSLHVPVCEFLQNCPPQRKLLLLPREHCKTSLVSHALPIHILIQPAATNIYFPGEEGCHQRIILACETSGRAKDHLRVIETAFEGNEMIRALWPHRCWENPRRQSKKWNDEEMIIPRPDEYPDPSVRTIGVDGAITGAHPSCLIKDDLVSIKAANSATTMRGAIDWHIASRALINSPGCLEFVIGTRWAIYDLYSHIQENDSTVEIMHRAVVENGRVIYPEKFCLEPDPTKTSIEALQIQFGSMFPLLYMNTANDPDLVDFDIQCIRNFQIDGDSISFDENEHDTVLRDRYNKPMQERADHRGKQIPRDEINDYITRAIRIRSS